jgi:hypothetical protein
LQYFIDGFELSKFLCPPAPVSVHLIFHCDISLKIQYSTYPFEALGG